MVFYDFNELFMGQVRRLEPHAVAFAQIVRVIRNAVCPQENGCNAAVSSMAARAAGIKMISLMRK